MRIAFVNYGFQSGVTDQVSRALEARGHEVHRLDVIGPLEYRDKSSGAYRIDWQVVLHLLLAAARYGDRALHLRWNTTFAFDTHSRHAGRRLAELPFGVDVILQSGALFSPGLPPKLPYVLLLDNTRQLAMDVPHGVGLRAPADYGDGWKSRETRLYRGAAAIGTFSTRVVRSLEADYGVTPGKAVAVGAGANVFPQTVERRDDGNTLLFVGTRFDIKGGPVLLRAFLRLKRRRPKLRLLVVGTPERLHLPSGVESLGYVPAERLAEIFSQATVFVLPTLQEAFGIAYLDAMAAGLPCVGTAVGAVPEILDEGRAGKLVPPGDDAALAKAIDWLLDHPDEARALGIAGRERVAARWRWSHTGERLEALLLGAASSSAGGRAPPRESAEAR